VRASEYSYAHALITRLEAEYSLPFPCYNRNNLSKHAGVWNNGSWCVLKSTSARGWGMEMEELSTLPSGAG